MNKRMCKLAILSISLLGMSATAVSSSIADISKSFPNVSTEKIMSIVTLPSMMIILFSLVCGRLSYRISKRKILFISLGLFIVGGVSPVFLNNINLILFMRCLLGMGIGMFTPFANSLIGDFYQGQERTNMMGLQSMFVSIGAMTTGFASGLLGAINWHYIFWVYLLGAIVLLLVFFFLPEQKINQKPKKERKVLPLGVYIKSILVLLFLILMYSFFTNLSIIISEHKLGNSTFAGTSLTIFYGGGILSGLMFGKILKLLRWHTVGVTLGIIGLGFVLISHASSIGIILFSSLLIGMGFAIILPYTVLSIYATVSAHAITMANAVFLSIINVGAFLSPFVYSLVERIFDNQSGSFVFLFTAICLFIGSSIAFLLNLRTRIPQTNH